MQKMPERPWSSSCMTLAPMDRTRRGCLVQDSPGTRYVRGAVQRLHASVNADQFFSRQYLLRL